MSVVVVATLIPVEGRRDEVVAAMEQAIAQVHADDAGCELYALHEGDDRLVMIEKWASQTELDAHSRGPILHQLHAALDGALAQPLDVVVLRPHPAGTPAQGAL